MRACQCFSSSCTNILDGVAPVRYKKSKSSSEPWLNEKEFKKDNAGKQSGNGRRLNSASLASLKDLMFTY